MGKLIAACGLVCSECEAYQATQANDAEALARVAAAWSKYAGHAIPPESVRCDGCLTESPQKCGQCAQCAIRACAVERGLPHCAACGDYGCEKMTAWTSQVPQARESLEALRSAQA